MPFKQDAPSNALEQILNEIVNVRKDVLISFRSDNNFQPIPWSSNFVMCVTRSTIAEQLLVDADAVYRGAYLKCLIKDCTSFQTIEIVLDSRSADFLCEEVREPEKIKNKLHLVSIWKGFDMILIYVTRWTLDRTNPAVAPTKDIQIIAKIRNTLLAFCTHAKQLIPYSITLDMPCANKMH